MKKGRFICKLVLFTAVLALLLGLAAVAAADDTSGCTATQHIGPIVEVNRIPATCTVNGSVQKKCTACGLIITTEPIIAQGHHYGNVTTRVTNPTCTSEGQDKTVSKCSVCGAEESTNYTTVPALGHNLGEWITTKAATCTEAGVKTKYCSRCSYSETDAIEPLGHDYGAWTVTKQPTCEGTGTETRVCSRNSSHKETRDVDAVGHQWGPEVTTPSTCTTQGKVTQTCQRDSSHTRTLSTLPLDDNNHNYGPYVVTTKPTCSSKGQKTSTCSYNSAHKLYQDIDIDPDAHVWNNGEIIKQPTVTEEGEKLYTCTLNAEHTKKVKLDTIPMTNNTVCAFGPRLRDTNLYPYNTDAWYMFTPFDASKEGTQSFELVASNTYIVGTVNLTIRDGNLKIDYSLADTNRFKITLEFFTVLHRINDLTQYEPEQLTSLRLGKGETINLEENFGDDTNLVLYFCSRCDFRYSKKFSFLSYESAAHQRQLSNMLFLMD